MRRIRLALRYALGSRLDEYRRILTAALDANYRVCSVEQSLRELEIGTERLFVLRHDVDQISPGVRAMAAMEAKLGVSSTYYFRLTTLDQRDANSAKSLGHEVSLHYETIADYAADHEISDRATLLTGDHLVRCGERLGRDIERFRAEIDTSCRTIASHGAPLNRQLGVANRVLIESLPNLAAQLGIELETYDRTYLGQFDNYISDTQLEVNDGFRYGRHPLDVLSEGIPRIMMLTHPNHWAFTPRTRLRRMIKCLLLGQISDPTPFAEADRLRAF
jgi:hypothetical protein